MPDPISLAEAGEKNALKYLDRYFVYTIGCTTP